MRTIILFIFIGAFAYGCGEVFDDGTENAFIDWGYPSKYTGATGRSRAHQMDTRKEIATPLVDAINFANTIFNNSYRSINTPLLLDNLTEGGSNVPHTGLIESGDCDNTPGEKVYNTHTFGWGAGYFRSTVEYKNFCLKKTALNEYVTVSGSVIYDEEFDNGSTSGAVRSVYSETLFDNLNTAIKGNVSDNYSLYGIMTKTSNRSRDTKNDRLNVDSPKSVRFGLDMPKGGAVYRFDFYWTPSSRYIQFYYPSSGYVTVDLSSLKDDKIGEIDPITMKFYDNETCIFTRYDLAKDKPNEYPRWFDCKKKDYDIK